MRIYSPSKLVQLIYSGACFSFPSPGKTIYLTFDDGPTDGVTQPVVEELEKRGVPATFFVTGSQVEKNPSLFDQLQKGGYAIGNHGFLHLNGLKTNNDTYIRNVVRGAEISGSDYFRPPYGKINLVQFRAVKQKYRVVFWSLMPYDFDPVLHEERILTILSKRVRPGVIIALHDNLKSKAPGILGEFIKYCLEEGFSFENLHRLNLVR